MRGAAAGGCRRRSRGASTAARLVTPAEIKELVPYIDESILLGGFYTPERSASSTRCAPARSCASGRRRWAPLTCLAEHRGARHRRRGRPRHGASAPTRGDIEAEIRRDRVRRLEPADRARWPARRIPLTPAVHQMIDVGPVPRFADAKSDDRVPDRPRHGHEHVRAPGRARASRSARTPTAPILHDPEDIPSIEEAALSPDRAPVHAGGLRAAARARARARARDPRRRVGRARSTRSTACSRSRPTACRSSARRPR